MPLPVGEEHGELNAVRRHGTPAHAPADVTRPTLTVDVLRNAASCMIVTEEILWTHTSLSSAPQPLPVIVLSNVSRACCACI